MKLPALIDPHVHMREPGETHKEDWATGTAAALAGGFTQVLVMPNTLPPVVDSITLQEVKTLAAAKAHCDFGLYIGAAADNAMSAAKYAGQSAGLKLYLNQTHGPLRLDAMSLWKAHFCAWPKDRPLVVHAEGRSMAAAILMAALTDRSVHLAHVATREEILLVRAAKEKGFKVSCEVTPHHLFLTASDLQGGLGEVRPRLASQADVDALWENMAVIDCFATDHAPHTLVEKQSKNPPPGFPGLETALPLLLTAVHQGRLSLEDLVKRMSDNVRQIFHIPTQPDTWLEVDLNAKAEITAQKMASKAGWTPFEGFPIRGAINKVVLRGEIAFENGKVLAPSGIGRHID